LAPGARVDAAEPEVLAHAEAGKDQPTFGYQDQAGEYAPIAGRRGDVFAEKAQAAALDRQQARQRFHQRRLAGAVGTEQGGDAAGGDLE
jgi:hypothetical protein